MFRRVWDSIRNLFGEKQLSSKEFGQCVFAALKKQVVEEGPVKEDLESIERLLAADIPDEEREKFLMPLYLRLEQYISSAQVRNRLSATELREYVYQHCAPERALGDMPLLFLPTYLQRMRLFEKYAEAVIQKSGTNLDPSALQQLFVDFGNDLLGGIIKNGRFDWQEFELRLAKADKEPDVREAHAEQALKQILNKIFKLLVDRVELIRAELIFREMYQQMRVRFQFLEEVPQVMRIIPEDIMKEERVEIFSKPKLIEELRRRNQELEFALSQLSEEKRKLEEERGKLAFALENLQKVDRAKSDFISVVSHQFRTPLSAARWNNEILMEEISNLNLGEKQEELLGYVRAVYTKLIFIINILDDVYDVLAIEGKAVVVERKPSHLWEIVDEALRLLEPETRARNVQIAFNRGSAPVKEILIDPHKMKRACLILLRNAIHYSTENGKVNVILREALLDGKPALSCSIQDFGIGIAPEDMGNIFTKFFRAKNAVQASPDGAGLGLYLTKNFIEAHGGVIQVESVLGKGSTFTFVIPQS